jgi:3-oxoacyl-[acyl-carrier-protein] synthase III
MTVRLVGTAFALPDEIEDVADVLVRERRRADAALNAISPSLRGRVEAGLAIERVRVCRPGQRPFRLAAAAAREALNRAGLTPGQVDLIIDYSTLPGSEAAYEPLAHALAADLGLEASLNLNLKYAGCAAFHVAVKLAVGLMSGDEQLRVALLVAGDCAPEGSRSLLPITVQGDGGSAAVLSRDSVRGTEIVATEVMTLGRLHGLVEYAHDADGRPVLAVDARRIEEEVLPVYYLHFHRLVGKVLESAGLSREAVALVVYANVSGSDSRGFARSLGFDERIVRTPGMRDCGHTFASDLVVNYTLLDAAGQVRPGDWLLFAAAGIGFTWGVTLARA